MAKQEKPSSKDFDAQREAQAKEARKKLKKAEKTKAPGAKKDKGEKAPKKKKVGRWLKDFRGELKKIVWPDFKTVLKNTGIVLLTTVIIGIPVWVLDFALSEGVTGLKKAAQNAKTTEVATTGAGDFNLDDLLGTQAEGETEAADDSEAEPEEAATEPATEPTTEPAE